MYTEWGYLRFCAHTWWSSPVKTLRRTGFSTTGQQWYFLRCFKMFWVCLLCCWGIDVYRLLFWSYVYYRHRLQLLWLDTFWRNDMGEVSVMLSVTWLCSTMGPVWCLPVDGDLLVPSSETMPSPSALFCLSKALRSRTLQKAWNHFRSALPPPQFSTYFTTLMLRLVSLYWKLTSMSASRPERSKRSLHPSYPSGIPAFSDKKERE